MLQQADVVGQPQLADDEPEPPVPAGLGTLSASLTAVAEFLCIDPDLLAAAADSSAQATADEPTAAQLRSWVTVYSPSARGRTTRAATRTHPTPRSRPTSLAGLAVRPESRMTRYSISRSRRFPGRDLWGLFCYYRRRRDPHYSKTTDSSTTNTGHSCW
jgi:hypothetical protein